MHKNVVQSYHICRKCLLPQFLLNFFCILASYNSRNIPPLFCDVSMDVVIFFEFSKIFYVMVIWRR
jgi:hypothetical protein